MISTENEQKQVKPQQKRQIRQEQEILKENQQTVLANDETEEMAWNWTGNQPMTFTNDKYSKRKIGENEIGIKIKAKSTMKVKLVELNKNKVNDKWNWN